MISAGTEPLPGVTPVWRVAGRDLPLARPAVLGILNITPDSFSDGGRFAQVDRAVDHGLAMIEAGADLVDVGGESSRPGSVPVEADEEWRRIGEVLRRLVSERVAVTVDTTKVSVARRALGEGACAINDISGLRADPDIADLVAESGAGLIVMHMRGEPKTMQLDVEYDDLVGDVLASLELSIQVATDRGVAADQIVVDPGVGFGKSMEGNLEIIARLERLSELRRPILVGTSRKSFLGKLLGLPPDERLDGTIASCVAAFDRGARLFRVHDVGPVRRALDVADAIHRAERSGRE